MVKGPQIDQSKFQAATKQRHDSDFRFDGTNVWFVSFGQSVNVKISFACQIFDIVIFFKCRRVLQFGAHSRYYKGAFTQKRSFLVNLLLSDLLFISAKKIKTNISTLNWSSDTLSK